MWDYNYLWNPQWLLIFQGHIQSLFRSSLEFCSHRCFLENDIQQIRIGSTNLRKWIMFKCITVGRISGFGFWYIVTKLFCFLCWKNMDIWTVFKETFGSDKYVYFGHDEWFHKHICMSKFLLKDFYLFLLEMQRVQGEEGEAEEEGEWENPR